MDESYPRASHTRRSLRRRGWARLGVGVRLERNSVPGQGDAKNGGSRHKLALIVGAIGLSVMVLEVALALSLSPEPDKGSCAGVMSCSEAKSHIGQVVRVEGEVESAHYSPASPGQLAFLDMGAPHPSEDRFSVVIWGRDRGSLPESPEITYRRKAIQLTER